MNEASSHLLSRKPKIIKKKWNWKALRCTILVKAFEFLWLTFKLPSSFCFMFHAQLRILSDFSIIVLQMNNCPLQGFIMKIVSWLCHVKYYKSSKWTNVYIVIFGILIHHSFQPSKSKTKTEKCTIFNGETKKLLILSGGELLWIKNNKESEREIKKWKWKQNNKNKKHSKTFFVFVFI